MNNTDGQIIHTLDSRQHLRINASTLKQNKIIVCAAVLIKPMTGSICYLIIISLFVAVVNDFAFLRNATFITLQLHHTDSAHRGKSFTNFHSKTKPTDVTHLKIIICMTTVSFKFHKPSCGNKNCKWSDILYQSSY